MSGRPCLLFPRPESRTNRQGLDVSGCQTVVAQPSAKDGNRPGQRLVGDDCAPPDFTYELVTPDDFVLVRGEKDQDFHDLGLEVCLAVCSLQQTLVGIHSPLPEFEPLL
jgi:hypothetical protein